MGKAIYPNLNQKNYKKNTQTTYKGEKTTPCRKSLQKEPLATRDGGVQYKA